MVFKMQRFSGKVLLFSLVLSVGVGASNISASETVKNSDAGKSTGLFAKIAKTVTVVLSLPIVYGCLYSWFTGANLLNKDAIITSNKDEDFLGKRIVERVPQDSLFEKITGYTEQEFSENSEYIKNCIKKNGEGEYKIFHKNGKDVFSAGTLDMLNMKTINDLAKKKLERMNRRKTPSKLGELNVLGINKSFFYASKTLKEKVDVSFLQSKEESRGKSFVVASNFNGLETLSHTDSVGKKFVNSYFHDFTQGPAVQLSSEPGALVKLYGMFYDENKDAKVWRQTDDRQVNFLDDLGIRTRNGYVVDSIDKIAKVTEGLKEGTEEGKFKLCYQKGVQVVADDVFNEEDGVRYFYDKDQKVDQIYVAAISLDQSDVKAIKEYSQANGIATDKDDKYFYKVLSDFAREVMKLNVKAALKSAFVQGCKELVLTLVGCGVFGNEPRWFLEALEQNKDFIRKSGLKVTLNISDAGTKFPEFYKGVVKLVKSVNEVAGNVEPNFKIWDDDGFGIRDVTKNVING